LDPLIGRQIGPYTITDKLGEGGMAVVYKARQPSLNRDVAIKILTGPMARDEEFVNRFRREAIAAGALGHPNILTIHDAGMTDDGLHYIVMELGTGGTLKDLLQRGPLPAERARDIAAQLASALHAAHEHGIVHRDLKPSNVLFARDGRPLLVDFGVALTSTGTRFTSTGMAVGTPEYMSPEQAQGLAVDGRSDVYSLGVVLYEMLTGDVPFVGDTPLATLYQQVHQGFSAAELEAARAPQALRDVVQMALAKQPDERFPDAAAMAAALRGEQSGAAAASSPTGPAAPTRRVRAVAPALAPPPTAAPAAAPRRNRTGLWVIVALAAVAIVAGLTYAFFLRGRWPSVLRRPTEAMVIAEPTTMIALSGDAEATVAAMVQQTATAAALATSQAMAEQMPVAAATITRQAEEMATRGALAAGTATAEAEVASAATQTAVARLSVEQRQTVEAEVSATALAMATAQAVATQVAEAEATVTAAAMAMATQTAIAVPTATPTALPMATPVPPTATPTPLRRSDVTGFEAEETWQRGNEPYGTLTRSTEQVYGGSYSGKLAYNFPTKDNDYVVFLHSVPLADQPDQLSAWVYGDGAGHYLNAWIRDAAGQVWQTSFGQIKHSGWSRLSASLRPGQPWPWGSVSGPDNGVVDYPIDFRAIVLDDAPDGYSGSGAIYLDRITTSTGGVAQPGGTPEATAVPPTAAPGAALSGTIAFPVFNTQRGKYDIYLSSPDGSNRRIVMQEARQPDLRDDGRLAVNGDGGGRDNVWSMNRDGGDARAISRHPEDAHPSWSGDGGRIAFDSLLGPDKSAPRLYVHDDLTGNNEPRMIMFGSYEIRGRVSTWLSDGRIVFNGCNYWDTGGDCGLYAVWDGGGQPSRLTSSADDTAADAAAPGSAGAGGQRIAFMSRRDGNWEIYVMNWDGGDQQNLSRSPGNDGLPAWSPDGQWIAFVSDRSGQWALWAMRPDGSVSRQLFALQGGFGAGDYDWALERLSWGP